MRIDRTHLLILNYNGARLLAQCLPSLVSAAQHSPTPCRVTVVDNGSTDESLSLLSQDWPTVGVLSHENRGLASFNSVLQTLDEPVVLLLNNDVKLARDAISPLLLPFEDDDDLLFTAPQCWTFDGLHYEGMRTRVGSRYGLVQGLCRVPGHEAHTESADLTAAAGPVLAVDRLKFLSLGGYDPLYFPGRIEDLDLGFRGWMAGWRGAYVPDSLAFHKGLGSFGPAFGQSGCDRLAARNTLLFTWSNLSGPRMARHLAWLPARLLHALCTGRPSFPLAFKDALARAGDALENRRQRGVGKGDWTRRQEAFFQCFRW